MPKYKLTYFQGAGRAEVTRMALCVAKQQFEDIRVGPEEWVLKKADTPQGVLPILEVDGQLTICQSGAIVRYVAREHGLYGKNNLEHTQVDTVIETVNDLIQELSKVYNESDPEKKAEGMKKFTETVLPKFVKIFGDKILCVNNGGTGWMVGSDVTVADLSVFSIFNGIKGYLGDEAINKNEKLAAHYNRVQEIPEIKDWLQKRPADRKKSD